MSIVEGLPWEVRVIIGGIADIDDLELTALKGSELVGKLESGIPVALVAGRGRKDGRITLRGTRLSDEVAVDVDFELQVRPPVWVKNRAKQKHMLVILSCLRALCVIFLPQRPPFA